MSQHLSQQVYCSLDGNSGTLGRLECHCGAASDISQRFATPLDLFSTGLMY